MLLITFSILTFGCASLQIQNDDSFPMKLTKVTGRVPLGLLTFGLSEAYYSIERKMKSWLSYHVNDLIASWGPPQQVLDDGMGGQFIIYTEHRTYFSPGYSTTTASGQAYGWVSGNNLYINSYGQSQTTYYPPQLYQWSVYRMFRVNSYGQIIAYSWKGL
jgi:hypothetical protein